VTGARAGGDLAAQVVKDAMQDAGAVRAGGDSDAAALLDAEEARADIRGLTWVQLCRPGRGTTPVATRFLLRSAKSAGQLANCDVLYLPPMWALRDMLSLRGRRNELGEPRPLPRHGPLWDDRGLVLLFDLVASPDRTAGGEPAFTPAPRMVPDRAVAEHVLLRDPHARAYDLGLWYHADGETTIGTLYTSGEPCACPACVANAAAQSGAFVEAERMGAYWRTPAQFIEGSTRSAAGHNLALAERLAVTVDWSVAVIGAAIAHLHRRGRFREVRPNERIAATRRLRDATGVTLPGNTRLWGPDARLNYGDFMDAVDLVTQEERMQPVRVAIIGGDDRVHHQAWPEPFEVRTYAGREREIAALQESVKNGRVDRVVLLTRWINHSSFAALKKQLGARLALWPHGIPRLAKELAQVLGTAPANTPATPPATVSPKQRDQAAQAWTAAVRAVFDLDPEARLTRGDIIDLVGVDGPERANVDAAITLMEKGAVLRLVSGAPGGDDTFELVTVAAPAAPEPPPAAPEPPPPAPKPPQRVMTIGALDGTPPRKPPPTFTPPPASATWLVIWPDGRTETYEDRDEVLMVVTTFPEVSVWKRAKTRVRVEIED
jgi:hypothetical protein